MGLRSCRRCFQSGLSINTTPLTPLPQVASEFDQQTRRDSMDWGAIVKRLWETAAPFAAPVRRIEPYPLQLGPERARGRLRPGARNEQGHILHERSDAYSQSA